MGILQGKTAVITGGTRGFGFEIARAYLKEGANVIIASRKKSAIERAVSELTQLSPNISGTECDVANYSNIEFLADYAIQSFGDFDIWVNNAGVSAPFGPTTKIDPSDFEQVLRINIFGVYYGSLVAMRNFLPKHSGKLINILGYGATKPGPLQNAYASSKNWVRSFTLALAKEHEGCGVGVFLYNPGLMETELLQNVSVIEGYEERLRPFVTVRRLWSQSPQIPAKTALWLASSATDGRSVVERKELSTRKLISGILLFLIRRFAHQTSTDISLELNLIPPFNQNKDG